MRQILDGILVAKYLIGFRKFIEMNAYNNENRKQKRASVILFLRYPTTGKVKTRLAATIGGEKAARIFKAMAENAVRQISRVANSEKYIFCSEENEKRQVTKWLGNGFYYSSQKGKDLGERMSEAFRKVFGAGAKKAIIVGSDIPDLSSEIIDRAVEMLDDFDAVVGPAEDGGYYLLGMKKFRRQIFSGIEYGTGSALEDTLKKMNSLGLKYGALESLRDIDEERDLSEWIEERRNLPFAKKLKSIYESNNFSRNKFNSSLERS